MNTVNIRIHAYDLCTPKYLINEAYVLGRYDHEQVAVLLYRMQQLDETTRALLHKNKMINLVSYQESDDSDFIEGKFITARYGKKQDIMDVLNQRITGQKGRNEGVVNEVYFVLDRNTGLLLVEHDDEHVISRDMLHRYFKSQMSLVEDYIISFNKFNKKVMTLPKNAYTAVTTVPSKSFFEELDELTTIKEVYVYADIKENTNNDAISFLTKEASQNDLDDYQCVKISLINKIKRSSIKHVKAYIKNLMELEAYDGYGVIGSSEGRRRQLDIVSNHVSLSDVIEVEININGLISPEDIFNKMIRFAKFDNPLAYKSKAKIKANKVYGDDNDRYELEVGATKDS